MTKDELMAQAPELVKALVTEGAAAERARIQGIEELACSGEDAKFLASVKFDGVTTKGEAAIALLKEQKTRLENAGAKRQEDAKKVGEIQATTVTDPSPKAEVDAEIDAIVNAGKKGGK